MNISVAVASDYDGDGDEDLFIGSRSVPYSYGQTPQSYLYQNDGQGNFRDVAPPALAYAGMLTGAVWADVSGDGKKELVVVGEWMSPKVFSYQQGQFTELANTGLQKLDGWWQSLAVADLNGDGRQDLVMGNVGENFYLRPSAGAPVRLWVGDLDGNGTAESFLTRSLGGRDMPVFLKREITEQFPGLRKANLRHSDYAAKSIQELFDASVLRAAAVRQFSYGSSVVALNEGGGRFRVEALPLAVQLSSVNAICATDLNGDGRVDLLLGGNLFGFPPQFGRLDASYGHMLLNRGAGRGFEVVANQRSGLLLKGEVKDIQVLQTAHRNTFLFTQNDSIPVLYQFRPNRPNKVAAPL